MVSPNSILPEFSSSPSIRATSTCARPSDVAHISMNATAQRRSTIDRSRMFFIGTAPRQSWAFVPDAEAHEGRGIDRGTGVPATLRHTLGSRCPSPPRSGAIKQNASSRSGWSPWSSPLILNRYAATPFHPTTFVWFLVGMLIGLVEQAFFRGPLARLPVYLQLILSIAIVALVSVTIMVLLVLLQWMPRPVEGPAIEEVADLWAHPRMLQIMVNAQIVTAGVMLFMAMERMVGTRMFRRFLTGRYVHPKRERIIVMFMDLADSTAWTEKLGDERYYAMLNETFERMSVPVLRSDAGDPQVHRRRGDLHLERAPRFTRCAMPRSVLRLPRGHRARCRTLSAHLRHGTPFPRGHPLRRGDHLAGRARSSAPSTTAAMR